MSPASPDPTSFSRGFEFIIHIFQIYNYCAIVIFVVIIGKIRGVVVKWRGGLVKWRVYGGETG